MGTLASDGGGRYRRVMRSVSVVITLALTALLAGCRAAPVRTTVALTASPVADADFGDAVGVRGVIRVGQTYTGGTLLPDATIVLAPVAGGSGTERRTRSDAQGRFELRGVPAGVYTIVVTIPRDTTTVTYTVTAALRPVQLSIPTHGGRVDIELLARYLPGSSRLFTAVDLISPER